jgi:AcrR family transcriptional regulator
VSAIPSLAGDPARSAESAESTLIAIAERLFADYGVGAVSLRAVMNEAGTNIAAVHYHFGSKQALLDAVVTRRLPQVVAARAAIVEQLLAADTVTVHDVAEALARPAIMVLETGGEYWLRLLNRLLGTDHRDLSEVAEGFHARNAVLVDLLTRLTPDVSRPVVNFRLTQAMRLTLDVLGDLSRTCTLMSNQADKWTDDDVIAQRFDVIAAILAGPPAGRPARRTNARRA